MSLARSGALRSRRPAISRTIVSAWRIIGFGSRANLTAHAPSGENWTEKVGESVQEAGRNVMDKAEQMDERSRDRSTLPGEQTARKLAGMDGDVVEGAGDQVKQAGKGDTKQSGKGYDDVVTQ